MRKLILSLSLMGIVACAEKLTGPAAQSAARANRNEVISGGIVVFVDGAEVDTSYLRKLDERTIESVEVLKGKAAMARFGARAEKGAIFVRTKQGK